jgi:hypothetical protein
LLDADKRSQDSDTEYFSHCTVYQLAVNDYVENVVRQDSGITLVIASGAAYTAEMFMQRIG